MQAADTPIPVASSTRAVPADLDPTVVAGIDEQLLEVARSHRVRVAWAVESGSRAWGFPSPDSDYDCRFLFIRRPDAYLTPWPQRDVIELPVGPVFDVNGWDLVKAVRLLVNGNATVGEWLRSPIVYTGDEQFQQRFLALAEEVFDIDRTLEHYRHVGGRQWPDDPATGTLKRRLYALRAAAALRWLREHGPAVPPMDLPTLMDEIEVPSPLHGQVRDLIATKALTRETGTGTVSAEVVAFVQDEFARADETLAARTSRSDPAVARAAATAFFQQVLARETAAVPDSAADA